MKKYADNESIKSGYNKYKIPNSNDVVYIKKQINRHHKFNSNKKVRNKIGKLAT